MARTVGHICICHVQRNGDVGTKSERGRPCADIADFLARGRRLGELSPAFMLCLADDGLEVRPLFWGPKGLVDVPVDRTVRYVWKDGSFEKRVAEKAR